MKQAIGIILGIAAVVSIAMVLLRVFSTTAEIREDFIIGDE